jgi:alpha-L-fucosidase
MKTSYVKGSGLSIVIFCMAIVSLAQKYEPTWESLDKRPVPQWYKDSKFGIFIHWGVYSVPGYRSKGQYAEWYQNGLNSGDTATINYHKKKFGDLTYYQLADQFKAELYNPDEWAQLIEKSGAKYVVLTSKHHDGFALWPSKEANNTWGFPWNAMVAGPHRDLLGDLFTSLRKTSVHPGLYYSLYEWYNPLWLKDKKRFVDEHEWPQMKDVINTYKPDVLWTDGEWEQSDEAWKSKQFLAWLYNESPVKDQVVTYDRWGEGIRFKHGGVFTPEYQPDVNFEDHAWEESRGMGMSYGYNRLEDAWDYNSSKSLILQLIDKVSGGGNFLLDIGPDEHGKIPPIMQERLLQIGDWMKANSESIYNTVRWKVASQWGEGRRDYKPSSNREDLLLTLTVDPKPGYAVKECFFTYNSARNNLYVILPKWPSDKKFLIKGLSLKANTSLQLLESNQSLTWHQQGNDVMIDLPEFDPNKMKTNYAYVIKIANSGAFAPASKVNVVYPGNSLLPEISIDARDGVEFRYTIDGSLPDQSSALYTKPFTLKQSGTFSVRSFKEGLLPGSITAIPVQALSLLPALKPAGLQQGLQVAAYELYPKSVKDLDTSTPVKQMVSQDISINDLTRGENSGLIYKGYIKIPSDGLYNFHLSSDDGSQLWIDEKEVIDNDGLHANIEKSGRIGLKKGYHLFMLKYIEDKPAMALKLEYNFENQNKKIVPSSLYWYQK